MSENNNIQGLFDVSGNLTVRAMERYISGKLSQDERAIVEKHLDGSSFDRDALEGLKKQFSSHTMQEVEELSQRVFIAVSRKPAGSNHLSLRRTYWYAAAGLALLVSLAIVLLFLVREPALQHQLAVNEPENENIIPPVTEQAEQKQSISEHGKIPETEQRVNPQAPAPVQQVVKINVVEDDVEVNEDLTVEIEADQIAEIDAYLAPVQQEEEEMASETQIFMVVEQMPEFPGGEDSLYSFIARHIRYPQAAKESGIQGRVFVTFVVEKDGSVSDARILRGIGGGCDEEALRMVQSMPKWIPGKQRGKPIRVQYNMPIKFTLE